MMSLTLAAPPRIVGSLSELPTSKSISNRVLLCDALSGKKSIIRNLATSSDTQRMIELLQSPHKELDVGDAGATMRFLTAYFAVQGQHKIMTGSARMCQRPIGPLVDALRMLGATIDYLGRQGFPPIEIHAFRYNGAREIALPGNVSSQYISALMMMAPLLPHGLAICLQGEVRSRPYIEMTAVLMAQWGVVCNVTEGGVYIPTGCYLPTECVVEPDWSSLSYWWAWAALADEVRLTLTGVQPRSIQGDRIIVEMMRPLGVETLFQRGNALLRRCESTAQTLELNFGDYPDLAQTVLPVCALKGVAGRFTGLESLRIKETDRIAALQTELAKTGARLYEDSAGVFLLYPAPRAPQHPLRIATYNDHRMAMGFSSWAAIAEIEIENPAVVVKSYPSFWDHLAQLGVRLAYRAT